MSTCQIARRGYHHSSYEVIVPGLKAMSPEEECKTRPLLLRELIQLRRKILIYLEQSVHVLCSADMFISIVNMFQISLIMEYIIKTYGGYRVMTQWGPTGISGMPVLCSFVI